MLVRICKSRHLLAAAKKNAGHILSRQAREGWNCWESGMLSALEMNAQGGRLSGTRAWQGLVVVYRAANSHRVPIIKATSLTQREDNDVAPLSRGGDSLTPGRNTMSL